MRKMAWSHIVYGSSIQCNNVEARHRSDKRHHMQVLPFLVLAGYFLLITFCLEHPNFCPKITTLVPMEGQWRIHYFILHLRDLLPQDYKAFCITRKSKACYWGVVCIWMNEWMMHLYSAFIVYCCTPKVLYNHVGGGGGISSTTTSVQHPLGWCDGCHRTTAPVRSPHTSYRWRGERVIEPIKWMGLLGGHDWHGPVVGIWPGHRGYTPTISLVLLFCFLIFTMKMYPVLSFNDSYHRCLELLCLNGFSFQCWLGTVVLDSYGVNTQLAKTSWGCLHWTCQSKVTKCQMFGNFRYRKGHPITFSDLWAIAAHPVLGYININPDTFKNCVFFQNNLRPH